jgi:hypothetical protein
VGAIRAIVHDLLADLHSPDPPEASDLELRLAMELPRLTVGASPPLRMMSPVLDSCAPTVATDVVERDGLGAACMLTDFVPSKTLIASSGVQCGIRSRLISLLGSEGSHSSDDR